MTSKTANPALHVLDEVIRHRAEVGPVADLHSHCLFLHAEAIVPPMITLFSPVPETRMKKVHWVRLFQSELIMRPG